MKKSILIIGAFLLIAAAALVYAVRISSTTPGSQNVHTTRIIPLSNSNGNVEFEWKLANPYVLKNSPGDSYLELRVTGKATSGERKKMNLVLVIDRSGSMGSENKLAQVQEAAAAILDQMNPTDRLGIVIYDDTVQTVLPSTPVENKRAIREVIDSLTPGGATNLCGGLQAGFEQARSHFDSGSINRVLLLSDGLANVGIIEPSQIAAVATQIRENSISVSSLGVGIEYNENLMANIADHSGGNYYYISKDVNMAKIFEKEWSLMQQVIATNAQANVKLQKGIEVVNVSGFKWKTENNELSVQLPDIYSGETKRILIHLRVPSNSIASLPLGEGQLQYTDIASDQPKMVQLAFRPSVNVVEDRKLVDSNYDHEVRSKTASVQASEIMNEAYQKWEEGDEDQARNLTKQAADMLKGLGYVGLKPQATRYEQLLNGPMAPAAAIPMEAKKDILKKNKAVERAAEQSSAQ